MSSKQMVYIVDDDAGIREGLGLLMESIAQPYTVFSTAKEFLDTYNSERHGCIVLDIRMPQMTGLELQKRLGDMGSTLPIIFITGHGDIPMAVDAMRLGALDFIRKPFSEQDLIDRIYQALEINKNDQAARQDDKDIMKKLSLLSDRELEIFEAVSLGKMNKIIAFELGISERTVEVHRSNLMAKLNVNSIAQVVRIKIASEMLTAL